MLRNPPAFRLLRGLAALFLFGSAFVVAAQTGLPAAKPAAEAAAPTTATAIPAAPATPIDVTAYDHPVRVACVGDSITYGFNIRNRESDSYPSQLQTFLGKKWEVKNFGFSGATLLKQGDKPYWTLPVYKDSLDFKPDVVLIMLGTNDCKPKNWDPHGAEFVSDYKELIKSYAELPTHPRIWIARPTPCFPGNWDITNKALSENVLPKIDQVAKETAVGEIDQYANLTGHADLFIDKVHPNPKGARMMMDLFYKTLTGKPAPLVVPVSYEIKPEPRPIPETAAR